MKLLFQRFHGYLHLKQSRQLVKLCLLISISYYNDLTKIEDKITNNTKAIIPVQVYGQLLTCQNNVNCKKHNLKVIEAMPKLMV